MRVIAVVIPFYQHGPNILARCLASVADQLLPDGVILRVVIVDDESPLPAREAVAGFALPGPHELVILSRRNGGPGAARNTALESLDPADIDYVAFLDSDDVWAPQHLADGLAALGDDGEFFFCDHRRWYEDATWFEASPTIQAWFAGKDPPFGRYVGVGNESEVYEFSVGRAFGAFIQDYMAQTSTVLYRFPRFADLRFDESLRHAGEDHLFWLQLANRAHRVRFLRRADSYCGEGVNIYLSAVSWASPNAAKRLSGNLLFCLKVIRLFAVTGESRRTIERHIWRLQVMLTHVCAKRLMTAAESNFAVFLPLIRERPSLILTLPIALLSPVTNQ